MAAIAWPELYPGAGEPLIWILRNRLKRLVYSGPETRFTLTKEASGVISPFEFLNVKAVNFVGANAILRLSLQVDFPLAAEAIELIDVGTAQKGLQGLVDIREL